MHTASDRILDDSVPRPAGPQMQVLRSLRRWVLLLALTMTWIATFTPLGSTWVTGLPMLGVVAITGSAVLVVIGWVCIRTDWAPWLGAAALAVSVTTGLLDQSRPWGAVALTLTAVPLFCTFALLAPGRLADVLSIVLPLTLATAIVNGLLPSIVMPTPLIEFGLTVQAIASTWVTLWAWRASVRRAQASDTRASALEVDLLGAYALEERHRSWREASLRLHETVLNTIRYVLGSTTIDGPRLTAQVEELAKRLRGESAEARAQASAPVGAPEVADRALPVGQRAFERGLLLVTAPLAGTCLTAPFWGIALGVELSGWATVCALLVLASGLAGAAIVLRQRSAAGWLYLLAGPTAAAVPWILLVGPPACQPGGALGPALGVVSSAVIICAVWSRWPAALPVIAVWALGSVLLSVHAPDACTSGAQVPIARSLAYALPLIGGTALASVLFTRSRREAERMRLLQATAEIRVLTAAEVRDQLHGLVHEAVALLFEVARAGRLDPEHERQIRRVDGQLRSTLQVDPTTAGAFARLARDLVTTAGSSGIPVDVRSIASSPDDREVPEFVRQFLQNVVKAPVAVTPAIQAFSDGAEDYVSVRTSEGACRPLGVEPGSRVTVDDVTLTADWESDERVDRVVVVASRPVAVGPDGQTTPASAHFTA